MKWSANKIAAVLARQVFERKHLVVVPNCNWTGHECDLLVVTPDLRVIDVEVKISRADFKADAGKRKWFHAWDFRLDGPGIGENLRPRQWPQRVWKHYYALPADIWRSDMAAQLPSQSSGVILLREDDGRFKAAVHKRAMPCRDADRISAADAVDIARLASLRMWDAFDRVEQLRTYRETAA